ncbi:MAG: Gfo/Idh/MocA family protein, partial [Thermoguttaceae bacterium]
DVRKLLENKDIDAVVVTTPNHWHALVTIWACQAGKDVFVQKPASHNIYEGRKMIEAARKYGRVVHSPTMSRSPNGIFESMEYVRQGNLGKLRYVHGVNYKPRTSIGKVAGPQSIPASLDYDLWCGPAPVLPVLREYLHYDWHWIWPYGNGDLGNMGIHALDGCRMAVGQDTLPRRVMSLGGRFGYDDDGQTPNSQLMLLDYEPAPIIFEVRGLPKDKSYLADAWDGNPTATMDSLRGIRVGMVVHCEGGYVVNHQAFDREGKLIRSFEPSVPNPEAGFLEAVRNRQTVGSVCDVSQGHLSAALVHLCNASYRLGKKAGDGEIRERIDGRQDFAAVYERFQEHLSANGIDLADAPAVMGPMLTLGPVSEQFTGEFAKEGNELITRHYRVPFVVPEKV